MLSSEKQWFRATIIFSIYLCCVTYIILKHHYSGKWVILSEIKTFCRGILFTRGVSISCNEILTAEWRIYSWEWKSHSKWDYKRIEFINQTTDTILPFSHDQALLCERKYTGKTAGCIHALFQLNMVDHSCRCQTFYSSKHFSVYFSIAIPSNLDREKIHEHTQWVCENESMYRLFSSFSS